MAASAAIAQGQETVASAIPRSLSDLTLIYCGKAETGQIFRSFSLKGPAIRLKRAKNLSQSGFPSL